MNRWMPLVEQKTRSGTTIRWGDLEITPESRALVVRLPFWGFVWNRPAAVVVQQEGRRERLPIHNPTRTLVLAMAAIAGLTSGGLFLMRLLSRGGKAKGEDGR